MPPDAPHRLGQRRADVHPHARRGTDRPAVQLCVASRPANPFPATHSGPQDTLWCVAELAARCPAVCDKMQRCCPAPSDRRCAAALERERRVMRRPPVWCAWCRKASARATHPADVPTASRPPPGAQASADNPYMPSTWSHALESSSERRLRDSDTPPCNRRMLVRLRAS